MNDKNINGAVEKMANGVPKADHDFMKASLCNDEFSTDEELQEHFVSQGVQPEHAAQYIKHRTRYLNEFFVKDDGTLRWPLKTEKDAEDIMKLGERNYWLQ